jgi:putative nucleotidyltransferase with HDIG domain
MTFYLRGSANTGVSAAWQHSMASAALAEHLAEMSSLSSSILYTAALLHDIGSLGLQLSWQNEYSSLVRLRLAEVDAALSAERKLFGVNHCEAGEALARTWGFPESLQRHIHNHHGHVPFEQDPVTNLVQTACRLAEVLGYPESGLAPGASQLDLEQALPSRFRKHAAFTRERLAVVVETQLIATKGPRG